LEDIQERKSLIEAAGLTWSVVESVPVHEAIKTRRADAQTYIENYRQSLRNLAAAGIKTVCYNFMPVLDWTRTQLDLTMADGSKALYFNWNDLAAFDLFILKREGAAADYPEAIQAEAQKRFETYTPEQIELLSINVLMGIPGERSIELDELRQSIREYAAIGFDGLRQNLI